MSHIRHLYMGPNTSDSGHLQEPLSISLLLRSLDLGAKMDFNGMDATIIIIALAKMLSVSALIQRTLGP